MAETNKLADNLVSMNEHGGFEVAEGEPDVRGWEVIGADGLKVGIVDDLMLDPESMKVRHLDIAVDPTAVPGTTERGARVPIGRARLRPQQEQVLLDVAARDLGNVSAPGRPWASDETRLTRAAEELRVGKRQVKAGEVEVGKHVETERVRQPVTRRREEVDIERRPVTGATARDAKIGEEQVRVPLTEEEVVVEKRPVVKEELVIGKHEVEETETVETDVRKEEFDVTGRDVDEHGRPRRRQG